MSFFSAKLADLLGTPLKLSSQEATACPPTSTPTVRTWVPCHLVSLNAGFQTLDKSSTFTCGVPVVGRSALRVPWLRKDSSGLVFLVRWCCAARCKRVRSHTPQLSSWEFQALVCEHLWNKLVTLLTFISSCNQSPKTTRSSVRESIFQKGEKS